MTTADRRVRLLTGVAGDKAALLAHLDAVTIRVTLPEVPSWHDQVLAITLVDLLGRLFPRLELPAAGSPAHTDLPPGPPTVGERLIQAALHGGLAQLTPARPDLTISVGGAGQADLHVDATGWQTYTGTVPSAFTGTRSACPVGPVAAACRAAAAAFGLLLHPMASVPPYVHGYASLLTYGAGPDPVREPEPPPPNAIDLLLVGAGSVGGAAIYTFAWVAGLDGTLVVVDREVLTPVNADRALLVTQAIADSGARKVDVARDALAHLPVAVLGHYGDAASWRASQPRRAPMPVVLSAVDSRESRREIQDCLPLRLLNAACGPREVTVSAHTTGDGPCVCCLHMRDVLDADSTRKKMIARETGLNEGMVTGLVVADAELVPAHLRQIEKHRGEPVGSLDRYLGRTLLALWNDHLLYGGARAAADNGATAVVATAFTTALAGTMLAAEALKHGDDGLTRYRLGSATTTQYVEDPYAGPAHGQLRRPARWPDSACLCRSARRARIASEMYGVDIRAT